MGVDKEVDNQAEVEVEMKLGEGGWLCKRLTGAKWWLRGLHGSIGTSFHLSRRRRRSCSAEEGKVQGAVQGAVQGPAVQCKLSK